MKSILPISIACLAVLTKCDAKAQGNPTPPCRAGTLDLRANPPTGEVDAFGIDYSATAGKAGTALSSYSGLGVGCNPTYTGDVTKKKGAHPTSATSLDTALYCDTLYGEGMFTYAQGYLWQQCYDTLKKFIEICPNYPQSWRAFNVLAGAAQNLNDPTNDIVEFQFQAWLKSVLYLNTTDPEYFCACVEAIPLPDPADTTPALEQLGTDRGLALIRWLLQNTSCDTGELRSEYDNSRKGQITTWHLDSLHGNYYPLDTTLPPLDSIQPGLQALLDKHFLYATVNGPEPLNILSDATANPNPTDNGTILNFGLSQEAYVKINLFDILGHGIEGSGGEGFEGLFEEGNHEVPLSLQDLPSGTYFARILTAYGNVATVKLVKE